MTQDSPDNTATGASTGLAGEDGTTAPIPHDFSLRANLKLVAYWVTLGAAAGGLGGALIGGIGGRVAMFILRLTSNDGVRGIESDDGFIIGRFSFFDTLQLIAVTTVFGAIVGLIVVAGRPFLPKRGMPFAWAVAGAITGGAILIQQDGVDFTVLEPHWLAVAFFVVIPGLGAGAIAWLTALYSRFWWRKRRLTALASVAGIPAVILVAPAIAALVVGGVWSLAMLGARFRRLPGWMPVRIAAIAVFALIVILGLADLTRDTRAII